MKALLYKDWRIMSRQVMMPLMLLWVIGMSIFFSSTMAPVMGVTLACGMLPFLTIAYDESCQYLRLALTQPIRRSGYVWSKYLPNLVLMALLLIYQMLTQSLVPTLEAALLPLSLLMALLIPGLATALLLPAVFQFGVGKTRLLYMALILGVTLGFSFDTAVTQALRRIGEGLSLMSPLALGLIGLAVLIALMLGSIVLSLRIVGRKDY